MKLKILLVLILSGGLSSSTLTDITSLIDQIQTVNPEQRFELMNQIKSNILSLNQNDQAEAIRQMRESRRNLREAKLAKFKAGLSPTALIAFEERLRLQTEEKKNYKARINGLRDGLSDEKKKGIANLYKGKRRPLRQRKQGKRITSKVQTTLTAEQLQKLKQLKSKIPHQRR